MYLSLSLDGEPEEIASFAVELQKRLFEKTLTIDNEALVNATHEKLNQALGKAIKDSGNDF